MRHFSAKAGYYIHMKLRVLPVISWAVLSLSGVFVLALAAGVVPGLSDVLPPGPDTQKEASQKYLNLARAHITKEYDLSQALAFYKKATLLDPQNTDALYELVRAEMVAGNYDTALAQAGKYQSKKPEDKKILYLIGLINGLKGDFAAAQGAFEAYAATETSPWQTRLDLAWVLYQKGEYQEAKDQLTQARDRFGDNAWLETSLIAVDHALGDTAGAIDAAAKARTQLDAITQNDWTTNYSFNGPDYYKFASAQMKKIIDINESIVKGKPLAFDKTTFSKMVGFAPDAGKGLVVSACGGSCGPQTCTSAPNSCGATQSWEINTCHDASVAHPSCATNPLPPPPVPTNLGQACTVMNLCRMTATGTVQCNGSCSAVAPLPPAFGQTCTITNSCGSAQGRVGCNGQCNVLRFPSCTNTDGDLTGGDDGWTTVTLGDDGNFTGLDYGNIGAQIGVYPSLVKPSRKTVVRWNSYEMSTCTVTGTNGDSWTGLHGEQISRAIIGRTTYTLHCTAFDGRTLDDKAVVNLVPVHCEIGQAGCEQ
jgi:tetratricopeptide (TPR) repeat protein